MVRIEQVANIIGFLIHRANNQLTEPKWTVNSDQVTLTPLTPWTSKIIFAASTMYGVQIQRRATVCFQPTPTVHMSCLHPQQLFLLCGNVHVSRLDSPGENGEYNETCRRNLRASYSEVRRVLHGCTDPFYSGSQVGARSSDVTHR